MKVRFRIVGQRMRQAFNANVCFVSFEYKLAISYQRASVNIGRISVDKILRIFGGTSNGLE